MDNPNAVAAAPETPPLPLDRERAIEHFNNLATAIVGHAQLALNNPTYECLRRSAQVSSECAQKMAGIARSILAMAAGASGVQSDVPLNTTVDQALKFVTACAPANPARIVVEHEAASLVHADPVALRDTLARLLSVAPSEGVAGLIHLRTHAADGRINLTLHYGGMAVSDDQLRALCAPLLAPAPGASESPVGVNVETAPDRSVTLTLVLPPAAAAGERRPARVLVVDDEPVILAIFSRILARAGHVVDTAPGGRVALEKLRNERYDIVLLDWMMPDVSGAEVLREGRAFHPDLPFVIVTAAYSRALAAEAVALGAVECIGKPLNHRKILHMVARRTGRAAPAEHSDPPATEGKGEILLLADPDAFHRNLYTMIFDHAGYACTTVATFQETAFAMRKEYFDAVLVSRTLLDAPYAGAVRSLRQLNPYTPILVIDDHTDESRRQELLTAGAAASLERPLELHRFLQDVRTVLDIYKEPGAARQ